MELKYSVVFGLILGIVLFAIVNVVFKMNPAFVDAAVTVAVIALSLFMTKLYLGKVKVGLGGMVAVSIVWVVVSLIVVFAFSLLGALLNMAGYFSMYLLYAGYALLIVFALVGHRVFGSVSAKAPEQKAPEQKVSEAAK